MSAEHSERKPRSRRSRIPKINWEAAVDCLGIPRRELERSGGAETMVAHFDRRVFVEYPGWWKDYVVRGNGHGQESSLLGFVLKATYPDFGNHGLETVYLDMIDLGRIPLEKMSGLRAEKIRLLPSYR